MCLPVSGDPLSIYLLRSFFKLIVPKYMNGKLDVCIYVNILFPKLYAHREKYIIAKRIIIMCNRKIKYMLFSGECFCRSADDKSTQLLLETRKTILSLLSTFVMSPPDYAPSSAVFPHL